MIRSHVAIAMERLRQTLSVQNRSLNVKQWKQINITGRPGEWHITFTVGKNTTRLLQEAEWTLSYECWYAQDTDLLHSKGAVRELGICLTGRKEIVTIQESYVYRNKVSGLRRRFCSEVSRFLNLLATKKEVDLVWVPGHRTVPANEKVEKLAKMKAEGSTCCESRNNRSRQLWMHGLMKLTANGRRRTCISWIGGP